MKIYEMNSNATRQEIIDALKDWLKNNHCDHIGDALEDIAIFIADISGEGKRPYEYLGDEE